MKTNAIKHKNEDNEYAVREVRQNSCNPNGWCVEYESELHATYFYGLGAKERAEEYAAWKNAS